MEIRPGVGWREGGGGEVGQYGSSSSPFLYFYTVLTRTFTLSLTLPGTSPTDLLPTWWKGAGLPGCWREGSGEARAPN